MTKVARSKKIQAQASAAPKKTGAVRKAVTKKDATPVASAAPVLLTPDTLPKPVMAGRDFLSNLDMTATELRAVMDTAHSMKRGEWRAVKPLAGLSIALVFEKASLRTRTTFDVGMYQLGGHAITLSNTEIGLGTRERVSDVARRRCHRRRRP